MTRNGYIIVRVDNHVVPSSVDYVGHGLTAQALRLRFTHERSSATLYPSKRDGEAESRRLAAIFRSYAFHVHDCTKPLVEV